jgi:hypothetical protein
VLAWPYSGKKAAEITPFKKLACTLRANSRLPGSEDRCDALFARLTANRFPAPDARFLFLPELCGKKLTS